MKTFNFILYALLLSTFSYAQNTFPASGNVGIGTTTPTKSLEVNGDILVGTPGGARTEINANLNHKVYNTSNNKTIDLDGNWQGGGYVGVYRGDNGTWAISMESKPNIGHQNNSIVLNEMRSDNTAVNALKLSSAIFSGDTQATNYMHMPLANSTIVIGEYGSYKKGQGYGLINKFKSNFEDDIHVSTGNVGIGTESFIDGSDTYRLSVDGKIRAHGVKVYTTWADYVFEEDYDLLSLAEVKRHIEEKGHLPNVPSAAEVEKNGIELGNMNAKLLEKIEELTLYIIAQDARIKELERQMNTIKE